MMLIATAILLLLFLAVDPRPLIGTVEWAVRYARSLSSASAGEMPQEEYLSREAP